MQLPAWVRLSDKSSAALTLLAAFVLHFAVSQLCPNLAWPDEIFQTIEQGHRLAFGYGVLPWEFRDGIRSWILPGMLGAVMRATAFLGSGSAGLVLGLNLFLSACSVAPVMAAIGWARREKLAHPWMAGLATAVWFELVFFSSKALTEVFAAYALPAALYYSVGVREDARRRTGALAGACWALTVGFRIHLAPVAVVAMLWICRKDLKRWVDVALGFGAVIAVFGLVDWVTWSYPFQSLFLNFWVNVVQGKSATFGVSPPWEYLASLLAVWSWAGVLVVGLAAVAFKRWPLLGVSALVILVTHSAIPHKEYRFLVPFLAVMVLSASLGLVLLVQARRSLGLAACALWWVASADGARRYDFRDLAPFPPPTWPASPMWTFRAGTLQAYETLSTDASMCGIASVGIGWSWTGGYAYLHRDVPMFDINHQNRLEALTPKFNVIVGSGENGPSIGPFIRETCWPDVCLYRRPGPCEPPGDYSINGWLKATDT